MSDAKSESRPAAKDAKGIAHDRSHCRVLVVCSRSSTSTQMRSVLKSLGFTQISAAPSHVQALDRARARSFSHVIFDARASDMPTVEFVEAILKTEESAVLIAVSDEPRIDDVFGILRAGARGFIVPPYTIDSIEGVVVRATDGAPLSEAVLNSPDRNSAFVSVILNNLDKLAVAMRHAREFTTAVRESKALETQFRDSVDMGMLFREGTDDQFREALVESCIARSKDAATRLGRLRKKLKKERSAEEIEAEEEAAR